MGILFYFKFDSFKLASGLPTVFRPSLWRIRTDSNNFSSDDLLNSTFSVPSSRDFNCFTGEMVDSYIVLMKKERKMSAVKAFAYATYLKTSVSTKKPEEQRTWASKQVYIALGFLLYTAALLQIDSCPMEGFDSKKCDNILGLNDTDYRSVVFCPIGYRAKDDKYATEKKYVGQKKR